MRIFFACPFTHYLRRQGPRGDVRLDADLCAFLLRMEEVLRGAGHQMFLAHRCEDFGAKLRPAHVCTSFDLLEMQRADCVVAFPEKSYGVHLELGWATAMDKPVVLILKKDQPATSPLLEGLDSINGSEVVEVPGSLLSDEAAQEQLCSRLLQVLSSVVTRRAAPPACAFLSTSFGFGPVSKAVSIAQELKAQAPHIATHYFGAGIDYDFAKKSGAFDRIFRVDVDQPEVLDQLVPQLTYYRAVFSVLNLDILPRWQRGRTPLYLVDSLAWMWPEPPAGLANVEAYFVQDYLMPHSRLRQWRTEVPLTLVAPIEMASTHRFETLPTRSRQLLVNFSGCSNPFVDAELFENYVWVLASAILAEAAAHYENIVFCCNEHLARHLQSRLDGVPGVRVGHFAHDEFLRLLASSEIVLSVPGITTTLEAIMLGTSIRFLLPQNYSQSLMSEHYRALLGDATCMALSRFGPNFSIEPSLPEEEGVAFTVAHLQTILATRQESIRSMVGELLAVPAPYVLDRLRSNISSQWHSPGQKAIVARFLSSQGGRSC